MKHTFRCHKRMCNIFCWCPHTISILRRSYLLYSCSQYINHVPKELWIFSTVWLRFTVHLMRKFSTLYCHFHIKSKKILCINENILAIVKRRDFFFLLNLDGKREKRKYAAKDDARVKWFMVMRWNSRYIRDLMDILRSPKSSVPRWNKSQHSNF